jgi:phage baseplate assembly protein W
VAASAISFKNVGKSTNLVRSEAEAQQVVIPIGIKTPLRLGNTTLFEMHTDLFNQIRDNLRNLLMTNWGERVGLYDFGANLIELSAERLAQEDYDQEVAVRVKRAVDKWMPYVALEEMIPLDDEPSHKRGDRSQVTTRRYLLSYSVPSINSPKQSLEIVVGLT